jgi:hypothetical protein
MPPDSLDHLDDDTLRTLLAQHRRNLAILTQQAAQFGISVPVGTVNQIESTLTAMKDITARLVNQQGPLPADPAATDIEQQAQTVVNNYYGAYADNRQQITATGGSTITNARQIQEGGGSGPQHIDASGSAISDVVQIRRVGPAPCSTCGQPVPPAQLFCGQCGTKVL